MKPTLQQKLNMANKTVAELMEQNNELLRRDKLNNEQYRLLQAENHALKAEIERTNRHINLAENALHKEQQPLVVNHYHNCTINK
jgi:hypothetical protein